MVFSQGDVFRIDLGVPSGSELGFRRRHVVMQNDLFNQSRISTVVVCALTSNLKRTSAPGNVQLFTSEVNQPKPSVVNISQLFTTKKSDLVEKIGTLSLWRIRQVLGGIDIMLQPREGN